MAIQTNQEKDLLKLLETDSSRVIADMICAVTEKHPELLETLLHMSFDRPYPVCMRAARALQLYFDAHPEAIIPYLDYVVANILEAKIEGIRRNYLKIIAEKVDLSSLEEPGMLISRCFEWLLDTKVWPATRIYCAEVIAKFSFLEPELKHELKETLVFVMEESPVSLKGRGRKILKRMQ